ncbi:MATE family efflux transporter [Methanobrevibacter sp. UBA46]|jgi:Na+-driven multidrug efflux pump
MSEENIKLLRGEPEKAINHLAWPIVLSMILTSLYMLIDGIWITGLGQTAIAGVGFVTPIFMILNGVSVGLGVGATSLISRYVGAKNRENASKSATHSIIIFTITSILLTILLLLIQKPALIMYGATGQALTE